MKPTPVEITVEVTEAHLSWTGSELNAVELAIDEVVETTNFSAEHKSAWINGHEYTSAGYRYFMQALEIGDAKPTTLTLHIVSDQV